MRSATYLLLILLFPFAGAIQSQNFTWIDAVETGYSMNPNMVRYSVKASPDGTTWFVGMKEQILSYTNMMGDHFVIRYDADGNKLEEYLIEGALIINAMETDEEGNLYMGGDFYQGDVVFWDGTTLAWDDLTLNGFVAKIQAGGVVEWARNMKEITGTYSTIGAFAFKNGTMHAAYGGWMNSWISTIDEDGEFTQIIAQTDVGITAGIDLDSDGNLYVTGSCSGGQSLFNGVSYTSPFSYNKYLIKYNAEGVPQWIHFVEDVTCVFPEVAVGPDDHVYWSGMLHNVCTIDTIDLEGPSWVFDFFIARFNPEGEVQWAREVPQELTGDAGTGIVQSLEAMPDNSVTFAGFVRGTVDWGNGVVSTTSIPGNYVMMVNFNSAGTAQWTKTSSGENYTNTHAIDTDLNGDLYLAGVAHDTATFDDLQVYRETYYYPLITKLEAGMATAVPQTHSGPEKLILSPNPVKDRINLPFAPEEIALVQVYSLGGKKVLEGKYQKHLALDNLPVGMYYLKVLLTDGRNFGVKFISAE